MARIPRLMAVGVAVLMTAAPSDAQPRDPLRPNPQLEPDRLLQIPPGEPLVEDYRRWLTGQLKQPPKNLDPKVLKELMDELNKMPKDKQPDKAQIEKMLKENPAFKDPEFL